MKRPTRTQKLAVEAVTGAMIEFSCAFRRFFDVNSHDELIVIISIMSSGLDSDGLTEKQICDIVEMPRTTVNRTLNRLVKSGHVIRMQADRSYFYIYNLEFADKIYGSSANKMRNKLVSSLIRRSGKLCSDMINVTAESHNGI